MKANLSRLVILLTVLGLVSLFSMLDLQRYLTLSQLKAKQDAFAAFYADPTVLTIAAYMGLFIVVTALSLPGRRNT